jgi:hypothetical protein
MAAAVYLEENMLTTACRLFPLRPEGEERCLESGGGEEGRSAGGVGMNEMRRKKREGRREEKKSRLCDHQGEGGEKSDIKK